MRVLLAFCLAVFVRSTPTGNCAGWTGPGSATICTFPADRLALNDIYNNLGGATWNVKDLWDLTLDGSNNYNSDPCNGAREWFGVFCANRQGATASGYKYGTGQNLAYRVTTLALANNNLQGSWPSSIYSMDLLANVFMSGNPGLTGTLSDSISGMTSLAQLQVDSCGLSGTLPQGLSSLLNLAKLYVQKNQFSGALPNLRTASHLTDWQLGGNRFVTTLPDYITQMAALAKFDIRGNGVWKGVSGTIPLAWGTGTGAGVSPLRYIDISNNDLSGIIPSAQLGSIGLSASPPYGLQAFYFQNNRFNCVFPPFLGDLSRGILFNATGNAFYCPYPDGISPATVNTGPYPILDQCLQANISVMYVNGDSTARTCTRGDASGCVVTVTGINFPINPLVNPTGSPSCPVVMSVNIATSDGGSPPKVTLLAEKEIVPSTNTGTTFTADIAGAGNTFTGITAGSKQLQLDIQMPDGTLFSPTGGQLPEPLFLLGVCNADCSGHGLCNPLSETCQCEVGYYGSACDLACDVPYIQYTYEIQNGINTTVAHQCNDRGICAYNNILGRPVCTCTLASDGKNLWDGLYCERVSCDQVYCSEDVHQGVCDQGTGTCVCNSNTYLNITGSQCQTLTVVKDWCGEEAGTDLLTGKELPAGRGVFEYNLDQGTYTCTCTEKKWEPNTDPSYAALQELNCDKKIPPTWPIILGCVLAGLVLIVIGIVVFLKIKKFDPEKKQKQMEMQALNG